MRYRFTTEQTNEIIKLYQAGVQPKVIGEKFGVFSNSITRIIRKNGLPRTNLIRLTEKQIDTIVEKYAAGISSEIIAADMQINGTTVCRALKRRKIILRPDTENKRKYKINDTLFERIDTEEKAYFLGIMYADGNLNKRGSGISISLHEQDIDILEKLSNIMYGFRKISEEISKDGNTAYPSLRFYSKKMHKDLCKLGCVPDKCFKIKFPEEHIPQHIMNHFIRGFFDGDGCISIDKTNRSRIDFTANIDFIEGLAKHFDNIDIKCGKVLQPHKEKEKQTRCFQIGGIEAVKKLIHYIYKDATIYMNRKYNKCIESIELLSHKRGRNIAQYGTTYVPEINGIRLTAKNVANILPDQIDTFIDGVFDFYRAGGFPYLTLDNNEIIKDFTILKNIEPQSIKQDENILHSFNPAGIRIFKHFSPHFYETNRMDNHRLSMLETFNDDRLLKDVIRNRLTGKFNINGNMIKQGLSNSKIAFKASVFNPTIAKFIYNNYTNDGDIIYDYSMGFGQRLLAALSLRHNVKYIGVDLYDKSIASNKSIFEFFNTNIVGLNKTADIVQCGSEDYCDEQYVGKVKLAFSSPPYFNMEVYDDSETQAAYNGDYLHFINNWWQKTVSNIHKLLMNNGYFILNMKEIVSGFNILEDMTNVAIVAGFKQIHSYQMKLSRNTVFGTKNGIAKYEPIVVFRKN